MPDNEKQIVFSAREMAVISLLIAFQVVFSRFLSFSQWNMRIGFSFVPIVLGGMLLGPAKTALIGAVADVVGAMLFPSGTFFPGFTLTAALTGLTFGLFLHKKQTVLRVVSSVALNQLVFSLLLNTLWLSMLYGTPFRELAMQRSVQNAINIPVQVATIGLISKSIGVYLKHQAKTYG